MTGFSILTRDFMTCLPETMTLVTALVLLILGLYRGEYAFNRVMFLAKLSLATIFIVICTLPSVHLTAFQGQFISDAFAILMKAVVAGAALVTLLISHKSLTSDHITSYEYPVLILFSTLGMMIMISANDLMSLFMGLELQSLSLYILVALARDSVKASEAAIKYFVLGALSSCFLLYGSSLIYGYSGVTNLKTLATVLKTGQDIPSIMKAGIAFIMAGLAFKISAAPFHVWTPDVYEGSPTPVTAFIASAPKIAGLALMVRVFSVAMGEAWPYWEILLAGIAMASMVVGSLGALYQKNIKRLLAYSAIGNMGYILTGIITGSVDGLTAGTIYIILYIVMITGIFACLLALNHRNRVPVLIDDLKGLVRAYPELSLVLCFLFFSLAGIPPLAGFLGKLYIFQSVIAGKFYVLAFVGILSSVVSAAYYLWLIKTILMDEPHSPYKFEPSRNHPRDPAITFVLTGIIVSLLGLFIFPDPLVRMASGAAASVMNNNYGRN